MQNTSDTTDIEIQELNNQLDRQISEIEKYRRQAAFFLRILIGSLGLIIALGQFDLPTVLVDAVSGVDFENILATLSTEDPGIFQIYNEIVLMVLVSLAIFFAALAVVHLMFELLTSSYHAAFPSELALGAQSLSTDVMGPPPSTGVDSTVIEEYRRAISHNQEILSTTRKNLQNCFLNAKNGLLSVGEILIILVALNFPSFVMIHVPVVTALGVLIFMSDFEYNVEYINELIRPNRPILISHIPGFVAVSIFFFTKNDLLLMPALFVSSLAPVILHVSKYKFDFADIRRAAPILFLLASPVFLGVVVQATWLNYGDLGAFLLLMASSSMFAIIGIVIAIGSQYIVENALILAHMAANGMSWIKN